MSGVTIYYRSKTICSWEVGEKPTLLSRWWLYTWYQCRSLPGSRHLISGHNECCHQTRALFIQFWHSYCAKNYHVACRAWASQCSNTAPLRKGARFAASWETLAGYEGHGRSGIEEYLKYGAWPYFRDGVALHDAQGCEPLFVGQGSHDVLLTIVGFFDSVQHRESLLDDWVIEWPCLNLMWDRGEVFVAAFLVSCNSIAWMIIKRGCVPSGKGKWIIVLN